jgi:hypothetical protein
MKKIVLSLAGVMAAVAFAPEASALPVFARQTGMACSACHFQHFPLLNGFGRAFKAAGYTMMGAQGKVESEQPAEQVGKEGQIHGNGHSELSLPNVLNLGVLTTTRYDNIQNSASLWNVPGSGGELSIFFGGRVAEFAGFLAELGMAGPAALGAAKLALLYPVGDARVGVVAFTGAQGVAHSFELLNTGAANVHKMTAFNGVNNGNALLGGGNHVAVFSAAQFLQTQAPATGLSLVANNSMGFVVLGKYEQAGVGTPGAHNLPLNYVRAAGTFDLAGFESAVGVQSWGGSSALLAVGTTNRATVIDGQMQGEIAGMPVGFYASYGTAPVGSQFNIGGAAATSGATTFNIAGELGVIPHVATLQLAVRAAKDGQSAGVTNVTNSAIMIGGTYELAQNVELSLSTTSNSGSAWNVGGSRNVAGAVVGKTETTLMMEALF